MPELIFNEQPGRATRVTLDRGSVPGSVAIQETDVFTRGAAVITGFRTSSRVHQQTQPSLGQGVYVLTFGDKPTTVRISGMCFTSLCNPDRAGSGIDQVLEYYNRNKASAGTTFDQLPLVTVRIGRNNFTGTLISCETSSGPAQSRLTQFTMTLQTFPALLSRGDTRAGGGAFA